MRKFIKKIQYTLLIALTVGMSGCSDALDIDPEDALTQSEIYTDYKDMFTIKLGLYNILQEMVEQNFVLGECRGDLVVAGPGAKGQYSNVAEFLDNNVSITNKYNNWATYYHLINQCNDALVKYPILKAKQPKLETDEQLSAVYRHIVGETLWLRAYAYFMLVQNWGDVPFYTDPIYTVEQSNEAKYNKMVSESLILDQLEKDLSYAFRYCEFNWGWANLPTSWNHQTVNMCAVVSLYTDVLMYRAKYNEAWTVSSKIVEGGYTSSFGENFNNSFNVTKSTFHWNKADENQWFKTLFRYGSTYWENGLILAFSIEGSTFKPERHPLTTWTNNRYNDNGLYVIKPSRVSLQYFMKNDEQLRGNYGSYLIDDQYRMGEADTIVWKYVGVRCVKGTGNDSAKVTNIIRRGVDRSLGYGNIHVYRTAGLWLRAAEAANRLGYTTKAIRLINEVRTRAEMGRTSAQQDAGVEEIENAIIEERALELAYEGSRWYDLVNLARRRNDPNFLIDKVVAKAPIALQPSLRARLQAQQTGIGTDKNWWHLPKPKVYQNN